MLMRAGVVTWLALCGALWCGGCALFGYDFDRYEPASSRVGEGAAGAAAVPEVGGGGQPTADEDSAAGAPTQGPADPVASTLGAGGQRSEPAGSDASGTSGAGGTKEPARCGAASCLERGAECGAVIDACGEPQACGSCFWWFEECRQNRCEIAD